MIDSNIIRSIDEKLKIVFHNPRHIIEASDRIIMANIRNDIDPLTLLHSIENDTAFNYNLFKKSNKGNIYDFVSKNFVEVSKHIINITAGGNGGMASIGRGEFFFAFMSNFKIIITKNGKGDLHYVKENIFEEVKYNGGKINVSSEAGSDINKKVNAIVGKKIDYIPFKKSNYKNYTANEISKLNSLYWKAISNQDIDDIDDNQLKCIMMRKAFDNVFSVSDKILIVDENGNFIRFDNSTTAYEYYKTKLDRIEFEIRSNQKNPCALYLHTLR